MKQNYINNIQQDIQFKQQQNYSSSSNIIKTIQKTIRRQNYYEAIIQCQKYKKKQCKQTRQLLQILQIDIMDKIFTRLQQAQTRQSLIKYIKCISIFLINCGQQLIQKYGQDIQREYGKNYSSLIQKYQQLLKNNNDNRVYVSIGAAINIIFQIKILSINVNQKKTSLQLFITDIQLIINMVEEEYYNIYNQICCKFNKKIHTQVSQQSDPIKNNIKLYMKSIFQNYFKKIHISLSKSIIYYLNNNNNQIVFNHALYQQILSDQKLLEGFHKIQVLFQSKITILEILNSLWNDFFNQITDILLDDFDIQKNCALLIQKLNKTNVKYSQFKKFNVDKITVQLLQCLKKYFTKISSIFKQILALFQKGSKVYQKQMMIQLNNKFNQHFNKINFNTLFEKIQKNQYKLKFAISLNLMIRYLQKQYIVLQSIPDSQAFLEVFKTFFGNFKQKLHQNSILIIKQFNFMKNLELKIQQFELYLLDFVLTNNKQNQLHYKQIYLDLFNIIAQNLTGKQKQKVKYTVLLLEGKQPQISIFSCLLNYLPSYLYNLNIKSQKFNTKLYVSLLQQNKPQKRNYIKRQIKTQIQKKDMFEIGQVNKEQIIKMASKSIYGFGNSLAGFIGRIGK